MGAPAVYLAGPMKGLTFEACNRWRIEAAFRLGERGIATINPVEAELIAHQGALSCSGNGVMTSPKAIVAKDRHYVLNRATAMLVNFTDAPAVSIGTCVEFGWADAARIPVVTVLPDDNPHHHAFIRELSGWVAADLNDAIGILAALHKD